MKFRHSFHVFIDNFSVTYKQLVYRLIISLIALGLYIAILTPFIKALTDSAGFINLVEGIKNFFYNLINGDSNIRESTEQIKNAFNALINLISENRANIAWGCVGIVAVRIIEQFFSGLGNFTTAAIINDKMALHANSPFTTTLIRNLKAASIYSAIYAPLSILYDGVCFACIYLIAFKLIALIPFMYLPIQIFIFAVAAVMTVAVKMTFTSDWLPAIIRGKTGQRKAFIYTFARRKKRTLNVLSNFVVLVLLILAVNVGAFLCTFGVGTLLTVPSSYVILVCFQFVNYYDREELKYFIDKNTIIKPQREKPVTREEFFKGE